AGHAGPAEVGENRGDPVDRDVLGADESVEDGALVADVVAPVDAQAPAARDDRVDLQVRHSAEGALAATPRRELGVAQPHLERLAGGELAQAEPRVAERDPVEREAPAGRKLARGPGLRETLQAERAAGEPVER